jgi:hypothetical protein
METEENYTMNKTTIKAIIAKLASTNLSAEDSESIKKDFASLSDEDKDTLRANLSTFGFYKKGGAWNAGMITEFGDLLRPNIGVHETVKAAVNLGLKGLGIGTGGYLAYQGGKAVLEKMGVVGVTSTGLAAADTLGAAAFGDE